MQAIGGIDVYDLFCIDLTFAQKIKRKNTMWGEFSTDVSIVTEGEICSVYTELPPNVVKNT